MTLPTKITIRAAKWEDSRRNLQSWIDATQNILARGFSFGDQVSELVTATYSGDPINVLTQARTRPVAVLCLSATVEGVSMSPVPIVWSWDTGTVTVLAAPDLTAGTSYALTLLVVES